MILEIWIPDPYFNGFYNTKWEGLVDMVMDDAIAEKEIDDPEQFDKGSKEYDRAWSEYYDNMDIVMDNIKKLILRKFLNALNAYTENADPITYASLRFFSPHEYNYMNDELDINLNIPDATLEKIERENKAIFEEAKEETEDKSKKIYFIDDQEWFMLIVISKLVENVISPDDFFEEIAEEVSSYGLNSYDDEEIEKAFVE